MSRPEVPKPNAEWIEAALDRYEGPLVRYALRLTGDLEAARDIVQDAFLRLCRADPSQVSGGVGPWLFTVCRNRALDSLRKEGHMQTVSDSALESRVGTTPTPEAVAERHDAASRALAALQALPANQREVVRLKFQAGLSYKEISEVTGLSVSNVGYLIHTAIGRLRASLADEPLAGANPAARSAS